MLAFRGPHFYWAPKIISGRWAYRYRACRAVKSNYDMGIAIAASDTARTTVRTRDEARHVEIWNLVFIASVDSERYMGPAVQADP